MWAVYVTAVATESKRSGKPVTQPAAAAAMNWQPQLKKCILDN